VAPNTECKLSTKVDIFIWGGLRGGMRLFWVASATPCHPGRNATAKDPKSHPVNFNYTSAIYLFRECFRRRGLQLVDCVIFSFVKLMSDFVIGHASRM